MKRMILSLTILATFSAGSVMAEGGSFPQSCFMRPEVEREMIITEGGKVLKGQPEGSECFERLVKIQVDMLKDKYSPADKIRLAVIQDMMASAIAGDMTDDNARE